MDLRLPRVEDGLSLIRDLRGRRNMAVMFITHDFGVVADMADRVIHLSDGRIPEIRENPAKKAARELSW